MPRINNKSVRDLRRKNAEERQAKYDALTLSERIVLASTRRGASEREITRLGIQAGVYPETVVEDRKRARKALKLDV